MSSCDTTSRVYGLGNPAVVSLPLKDGIFKEAYKISMTPGSNHKEITQAREKALLPIEKGKNNGKTLNDVWVWAFTRQVGSADAFVQAERLPPILATVKYYFYRYYLQILNWQETPFSPRPEEWGWCLSS